MNQLKNIRSLSLPAAVIVGGLLAASTIGSTHSAKANVEDYEINAATISGDQ